jgi:hypothetical protein
MPSESHIQQHKKNVAQFGDAHIVDVETGTITQPRVTLDVVARELGIVTDLAFAANV